MGHEPPHFSQFGHWVEKLYIYRWHQGMWHHHPWIQHDMCILLMFLQVPFSEQSFLSAVFTLVLAVTFVSLEVEPENIIGTWINIVFKNVFQKWIFREVFPKMMKFWSFFPKMNISKDLHLQFIQADWSSWTVVTRGSPFRLVTPFKMFLALQKHFLTSLHALIETQPMAEIFIPCTCRHKLRISWWQLVRLHCYRTRDQCKVRRKNCRHFRYHWFHLQIGVRGYFHRWS